MSDIAPNLEASFYGTEINVSQEFCKSGRATDAEMAFHATTIKAERAGTRVNVQLSDDKGQFSNLLMTEDLAWKLRTALREILG